jgi:hypothetical protein
MILVAFSVTPCWGAGDVPIRIDFANPMYSKLDEEEKKILTEYAMAYPQIKLFYQNIRLDASCQYYRCTEDK